MTNQPYPYRTGAMLGPAPDPLPPPYDIQRRDDLFAQIQSLKARAAQTEITRVEQELDTLLEGNLTPP